MSDATHPLAAAGLQQEAGEPVAWGRWCEGLPAGQRLMRYDGAPDVRFERSELYSVPLYTTPQVSPPQARVPLTTDEVLIEWSRPCYSQDIHIAEAFEAGVRFAERAHLIGLETKE